MDDYTLGFFLGRTLYGVLVGTISISFIVGTALALRAIVGSTYPVPTLVFKTSMATAAVVTLFVALSTVAGF